MPKQVDHEQRRQELTTAVWRIVAGRGLHAVSLREVAAHAGVSMGTVQHYFGTSDRMVRYACQRLVDLAGEGLRALVADAATATPREVLRLVAVQTLPDDDARRAGAGVWLAFVTHALQDPGLTGVVREAWAGAHRLVAGELRRASAAGQLRGDADPAVAATALLALLDGLLPRLVVGVLDPHQAHAVVEDHLDRLFAAGR